MPVPSSRPECIEPMITRLRSVTPFGSLSGESILANAVMFRQKSTHGSWLCLCIQARREGEKMGVGMRARGWVFGSRDEQGQVLAAVAAAAGRTPSPVICGKESCEMTKCNGPMTWRA